MAPKMMLAAAFVALWGSSAASEVVKGEWGQEVLGCRCKGRVGSNGYCGYHFHWGSQEDFPWCRTQFGCGEGGMLGSWMQCDPAAVERRRAHDGKLYTSKQFKEFYPKDGKEKWEKASPYTERRLARNNRAYSVFEFRDYYVDTVGEQGWVSEWKAAKPEERKANDGKWYSWEDFEKFYEKSAWEKWDAAAAQAKNEL